MKTTIHEENKTVTVNFDDELDTAATIEAETLLQPLSEVKERDIVLDCTNMKYVSSRGLRLFLSILKAGKSNNCTVTLKGVNDEVMKVLKMTGFASLFDIK